MAPCVKDVNVILISRGFDSREFGTKEESARTVTGEFSCKEIFKHYRKFMTKKQPVTVKIYNYISSLFFDAHSILHVCKG